MPRFSEWVAKYSKPRQHWRKRSRNIAEKHLILIDTPGLARPKWTAKKWPVFFPRYPGMDTHLVPPASMRASDLKRVAEQYPGYLGREKLLLHEAG